MLRRVMWTLATVMLLASLGACANTLENFEPYTTTTMDKDKAFYRCRMEAKKILYKPGWAAIAEANEYMEDCMAGHGYKKKNKPLL